MQTLFGFLAYWLLGRRWILTQMKAGLREAVFASEMEHELALRKHRDFLKEKEAFEAELNELQDAPEPSIPDDIADDAEKRAAFKREHTEAMSKRIDELKKDITNRDIMMQGADGEVGRTRALVMNNRMKYDFVKNYRLR